MQQGSPRRRERPSEFREGQFERDATRETDRQWEDISDIEENQRAKGKAQRLEQESQDDQGAAVEQDTI